MTELPSKDGDACLLTLGALGSTAPVDAPIPRLAFHLASDSSSASSCEYSASDFFSPTLYPAVAVIHSFRPRVGSIEDARALIKTCHYLLVVASSSSAIVGS